MPDFNYVIPLSEVRLRDSDVVGGKNASLGEMISQLTEAGVRVPGGFATTSHAFRDFLRSSDLKREIDKKLKALDVENVNELAEVGASIREKIVSTPFSNELEKEIEKGYVELVKSGLEETSFAVRSSATAEDLPDASFAGQQESFLNISGLPNILDAIKYVFASLYNDRAIAYRVHQGFDHESVALSAAVQRMVRSDKGASGVMFTIDTESGFDKVVLITSAYGLGETVVQGQVNPDEFYVFKPALEEGKSAILKKVLGTKAERMIFSGNPKKGHSTIVENVPPSDQDEFSISDMEVTDLAKTALLIEKHYGRPMDIEWGRDGDDGKLYVLQARPETVKSRENKDVQQRFRLKNKSEVIITGRAIGNKIGAGRVRVVEGIEQMSSVEVGDILVADMTDPDWEPVMKKAAAIVTNRGGRTCHAAIIARELGVPAVVGCVDATEVLTDGNQVTVSCSEGDTGYVYRGALDIEVNQVDLDKLEDIPVKIMMNVANPDLAFDFQRLPNNGVGLARLEFIIARMIGIHPKAALAFPNLPEDVKNSIARQAAGYGSPKKFYVDKLAEGIATLAGAFYPKPVIVRMSDFKSNEYSSLIGGKIYEPVEENPMLGFRGAGRYISQSFQDCFALECQAIKRVREDMGLTNVELMIPFVRTLAEASKVCNLLADQGLKRGHNQLRIIMMCELPTNALLAKSFLDFFDGFSIGSNDMTQLTLGLDRDSGIVAGQFDERDPAVKKLLHMSINAARDEGKYVGICGQGPSDYPDFAEWLLDEGIDSISLNPDTVVDTWFFLIKHLKRKKVA